MRTVPVLVTDSRTERGKTHTLFTQVIRFLVHDTRGPPVGLGLFGIASGTRGGSWRGLASVVRVSDLLTRLDELDKGLGNHAAVELLEVFQGAFVIASNLLGVSHTEGDHIVGCGLGIVIVVRYLVTQTVIGNRRGGPLAAADAARRGVHSTCCNCQMGVVRNSTVGKAYGENWAGGSQSSHRECRGSSDELGE